MAFIKEETLDFRIEEVFSLKQEDFEEQTEYYHSDDDDRSGDEGKPVYSEDEAVSHHGLRRSQSVKITRSRLRKDARYGSLKIKGKKRPVLNAMNYTSVEN